jgi:hypothetical protein
MIQVMIGGTMTFINKNSIFQSHILERELNATCEMVQNWLHWIFGIGEKLGNALTIENLAITLLAVGLLLGSVLVYRLKHLIWEECIYPGKDPDQGKDDSDPPGPNRVSMKQVRISDRRTGRDRRMGGVPAYTGPERR